MKKVDEAEVLGTRKTSIIDMEPGRIEFRGHPIQDLNRYSNLPTNDLVNDKRGSSKFDEAALFEAALVAAVDHGPQAPSIAAARMAITPRFETTRNGFCSEYVGDIHGGAGEQCAELFFLWYYTKKCSKALSFKRQLNWVLTSGMLLMGKLFLVLGIGFINQMTQEHFALWL